MYNVNRQPIHNVKTKIYIASWLRSDIDDYGNTINVYDEPKKYMFNVQILNESIEMEVFGRKVNCTRVISIPEKKKYLGKFKEYDLVYIDKEPTKFAPIPPTTPQPTITPTPTPTGELEYGDYADYRITGVRVQNTCILLYLTKLQNEQK